VSRPPGTPLRIGVTIGESSVPRWALRVLDQIDACSFAEIVGCVPAAQARRSARSRLLYEMYCRLDERRLGGVEDPLAEIDVSGWLAARPAIGRASGPDALGTIRAWELDVMLALGRHIVLDCARYGTWSYWHGDGGEAPFFQEVYDGEPVCTSALHRCTDRSFDAIYRSASSTDRVSLQRSRARVYSKTPQLALRTLRDVHRDGELTVLEREDRPRPASPRGRAPTNRQMLRFAARLAGRVARREAHAARAHQQWFLAYQRRGPGLPTTGRFRGATVLRPPADRFYADPCLVERDESAYLFFEEFVFAEGKGAVACCRLTPDGSCTPPEVVLERPYHLSYPFVFFAGGEAFMVPESAANGTLELYRANAFPRGWVLDTVLMSDVQAVDPTFLEHDGRRWLFANIAVEGASHDDELCLFGADSVRGPWGPHPRNPVVSDVRQARPAGRPFVDEDGTLIRPSQDCAGLYGSAVVLSRIEALDGREYRETPVGRLEPSWHPGNLGTHTYARSASWEALDGRIWRRRASTSRR
jgi:hypothetical protein